MFRDTPTEPQPMACAVSLVPRTPMVSAPLLFEVVAGQRFNQCNHVPDSHGLLFPVAGGVWKVLFAMVGWWQ